MYTEIVWQRGMPCELPDVFNPFSILVCGAKDTLTIGRLKEPSSYNSDDSKDIIRWIAQELLYFILLEQSQDLEELTIKKYIDSGNWIIKYLSGYNLDYTITEDYIGLTKIFQTTASKINSDLRNRSADTKVGNRGSIEKLDIVNRFIAYLFPNDSQIISDHLARGNRVESIIEPPSEFCVVETTRYIAKRVELEEIKLRNTILSLRESSSLTESDIASFFKLSKNYRNSFLYLLIAITGINGTNSTVIALEDLEVTNNKKTSGKSVSVYKKRANKVVSFEIPKEILTK